MESTIEKKKKKPYMRSSPIDLIGEAELHDDGQSQWQWSRQRKKKKERECVCKEKKKRGEDYGEIIQSSWWITSFVLHSSKRLLHI